MRVVSCKIPNRNYNTLKTLVNNKGITFSDWLRPLILQSLSDEFAHPQSTKGKPKEIANLYLSLKELIRKYEKEGGEK